ncbi:glycosyltransferase [Pseudonocardia sp. TRM90224]|uniref:glycosyltransferase n=1 Tax=Pseudonocardia sp. TRM90224 TaxID=2812678 RepID=UPI001E3370EE|nr:glycosyltransferase [Pseudonocardia sp. TRM90224]
MRIQPVADEFAHLDEFEELIGPARTRRMHECARLLRERLDGGVLWHVNSTAAGGGVAEMLHTLVPLYRSLGVRAGWMVVGGDEEFFTVTKRLGAGLYGSPGDGGPLGARERAAYLRALAGNAEPARALVGPRDVLVLHDHQTAGLAELLHDAVSATYWRCHVGVDEPNAAADRAWGFLSPLLDRARGLVYSVRRHAPDDPRVAVIPPFLSPFSEKNRALTPEEARACLAHCGLGEARGTDSGPAGGGSAFEHPARVVADGLPQPGEPLLVQVSRWDLLKDMHGVLAAFAEHTDSGHLALVGPDPGGIPDDVEQKVWFDRCLAVREALPAAQRCRATLVCLSMADLAENAVLVNGIQRSADVVLQKSLAEGFGLTVTEAMWKSKPVVASAVGGIREQITHGHDGLLIPDATDLAGFGALMGAAVAAGPQLAPLGARAHERVLNDYLPDVDVVRTAALLGAG